MLHNTQNECDISVEPRHISTKRIETRLKTAEILTEWLFSLPFVVVREVLNC